MRSIVVTEFGPPEVLQTRETAPPTPGPGELLVAVEAVHVLDLDTKLRAGAGQEWFALRPPYIPGGGIAGRVVAVGAGVDETMIGRRVLANTVDAPAGGSAAQAVATAAQAVPVPDGVDAATAAPLVHDGVTAIALFDHLQVSAGDRVLVLGAAGGAASLLVQLAGAAGATVVGAARGDRKLDAVRTLGAAAVVDYADRDWVAATRAHLPGGATVVLDGVGGELGRVALEQLTARGARFSAHGAASGDFSVDDRDEVRDRLGVRVSGIEVPQAGVAAFRSTVTTAVAAVADGRLRPLVGITAPLEKAADVHRAIEAREVAGTSVLVVEQ